MMRFLILAALPLGCFAAPNGHTWDLESLAIVGNAVDVVFKVTAEGGTFDGVAGDILRVKCGTHTTTIAADTAVAGFDFATPTTDTVTLKSAATVAGLAALTDNDFNDVSVTDNVLTYTTSDEFETQAEVGNDANAVHYLQIVAEFAAKQEITATHHFGCLYDLDNADGPTFAVGADAGLYVAQSVETESHLVKAGGSAADAAGFTPFMTFHTGTFGVGSVVTFPDEWTGTLVQGTDPDTTKVSGTVNTNVITFSGDTTATDVNPLTDAEGTVKLQGVVPTKCADVACATQKAAITSVDDIITTPLAATHVCYYDTTVEITASTADTGDDAVATIKLTYKPGTDDNVTKYNIKLYSYDAEGDATEVAIASVEDSAAQDTPYAVGTAGDYTIATAPDSGADLVVTITASLTKALCNPGDAATATDSTVKSFAVQFQPIGPNTTCNHFLRQYIGSPYGTDNLCYKASAGNTSSTSSAFLPYVALVGSAAALLQ